MPQPIRSVPLDFAVMARNMKQEALCAHYACGKGTLRRWLDSIGRRPISRPRLCTPRPDLRRPAPVDFREIAPTLTQEGLCRHYKASTTTIARWQVELDVSPRPQVGHTPRPMPSCFARTAPTMSLQGLKAHYRSSDPVIHRWCEEAGVRPAKHVPKPAVHRAVRQALRPQRDDSRPGEAADFLRKTFTPVCRLRTLKPGADKDLWIVGRLTLTTADLIAKAEAKGWDAGAWSKLAWPLPTTPNTTKETARV